MANVPLNQGPHRVPIALVLDTDRSSLREAEEWLRTAGWTVLTAGDPAEAVRYADRLGTDLAVLVIDLSVAMDGIAPVIARIRKASPQVGVVGVGPGEVPDGMGDAHLARPLTQSDLRDAARAAIPTGCHYTVLDRTGGSD